MQVARGDVLWLPLAQSLSKADDLRERCEKTRPFIVLQDKTSLRLDAAGCCLHDLHLLGVDTTSQATLVEGRPHVPYHLPNSGKDSFALLDSIRTVQIRGLPVKISYSLKAPERQMLTEGLDAVLQPEQRFFLRALFNRNKGALPGQIWTVNVPTGLPDPPLREAEALVLLRRGPFYLDDDEQGYTRFTPFMVAQLPDGFTVQDLRALSWNNVTLTPLHERSFVRRTGQLTDETVAILLNTLRKRVGIGAIEYREPPIRHIGMRLTHALFTPFLTLRGGR